MTAGEVRGVLFGRAMLVLGLFAAFAGAALPTGIMVYHAVADGVDYTTVSWALIAPIWGLLALLWLLVRRWPVGAAVPMGWLAIVGGLYYSDVYSYIPAAVLFLLAAAVVFLPDVAGAGRTRTPDAAART